MAAPRSGYLFLEHKQDHPTWAHVMHYEYSTRKFHTAYF